jgi:hypothetical protein
VVAGAVECNATQIVRVMVGRRTADEFVGDFDGVRVVGDLQIKINCPIQSRKRRSAIQNEFVKAVGCLAAITELVEGQREVANTFLIAGFALQLLEPEPNKRISRSPDRKRAKTLVDGGKHLIRILVEIAGACGRGDRKQQ